MSRYVRERAGRSLGDERVLQVASTRDVLDRYIAALGGTLNLVADFGDEQLKVG